MKKILLLLLCVITICVRINSQNIQNKLNEWAKVNAVEKVYLHLDRENYFAGQTIWFKGYFISGLVPSAKNSTLYAELINSRSEIVLRGVFPASLGATWGQLELPESTPTGIYQLRAYSPLMLNQPGFVFHKRISIFGKESKKKEKEFAESKSQISFFPEGGNMVTGMLNIIAFKAVDKYGMPLNMEGEIKNNKGEVITNLKTVHDGMGTFPIIPQPGSNYFATVKGSTEQYPLPQQTTNGIAFTVRNTSRGKQFKIQYNNENETFKPAYLIGQMENEVVFTHPLPSDKKEISGIIPTTDSYSGILHLTIFNKDNMPLAERLTFIDNKEYLLSADFKIDTLNTDQHKRNRFSIAMKDTIIGNFSVSITDADYDEPGMRPQNIYSWFLLNSDIKGYVHNPAYYFSASADSIKNALDLVMLTHGWTRFKWSDVSQNKLPPPQFKDPAYINLSGLITIEGRKKPLANQDIIVFKSPLDTSSKQRGIPLMLKTDSEGHFKLDSQVFYDKYKILFSEVRGKKSKFIEVQLAADSIRRKYPVQPVAIPMDSAAFANNEKMVTAFDEYLRAEGKTLENVTVKVRQKSEIEKLEERYASGLFSGGINNRTYDLRNEITSGDIFQYLRGRIAGLTVSGTPGNYILSYRGGGFGGNNVTLFLDEMQTDADMVSTVSVSQIAMIKLLPNSIAVPGNGTALAIYTKRGEDFSSSVESATDIITYNGYNVLKEFYNPNYDQQPNPEKADNRLTLSWQPSFFVSNVDPEIPIIFYNNDRTKRFKIVAEGITEDGRMLMIEKIVEAR